MANPKGARRFRKLRHTRVADLEVPVAEGVGARLLGLALLPADRAGPGLLIPRCSAVHTFGMRFALDLFFLGEGGEVIERRQAVQPNRLARCPGTEAVLEIPTNGILRQPGAPRVGEGLPEHGRADSHS